MPVKHEADLYPSGRWVSSGLWLGLALSLLLLPACENRRLEVKIKPAEPPAAVSQSDPEAEKPKATPEADLDASGERPATAALPPGPEAALPKAARAEVTVDDDPDALMGLDRESLEGRLGRPVLVRLEDPAEVWQYRGEGCVFDLFLYPDNGSRAVVYLEARDLTAQPIEARPCLRGLLETRAAKPIG